MSRGTRVKHKDGMTFRSKLEYFVYNTARASRRQLEYEPKSAIIDYTIAFRYQPDFVLPNGIIIEAKGRLDVWDRRKMIAVKAQHPHLDIRFVFQKASMKLSRAGKTYGEWADAVGFPWSEGTIPLKWWGEQRKEVSDDGS